MIQSNALAMMKEDLTVLYAKEIAPVVAVIETVLRNQFGIEGKIRGDTHFERDLGLDYEALGAFDLAVDDALGTDISGKPMTVYETLLNIFGTPSGSRYDAAVHDALKSKTYAQGH